MPGEREFRIQTSDNDVTKFTLVEDSPQIRAISRQYKATNAPDPGRLVRVQWEISGPIGNSFESTSKTLGVDYVQNLETRYLRRLVSAGELVPIPLQKPPHDTKEGFWGTFKWGDPEVKWGGLAASGAGAPVRFMDEQGGSIFAHAANISSQVEGVASDTFNPVSFHAHDADVEGAVSWHGNGRITLGNSAPVQTRSGVTPVSAKYADTLNFAGDPVFGGAEAVGSDRLWMVDASEPGSSKVTFTLDDLKNFAASFQVGDPRIPANGIGPHGPFTYFGTNSNLYSFTDQGKPVPLSRALIGHLSSENGEQWADPGWGWNYAITNIGLRAISGSVDNPVGIGERMREFTGHNGKPIAVFAERGELWVAYQTTDGDVYIYRCTFSTRVTEGSFSGRTASTGQPDMYPAHFLPATETRCIFSTNTSPNTTMLYGNGVDILRETIARDGRDDLFPARRYSQGGGTWYGTCLDREPHLMKSLRLARVHVLNVEDCSDWQLWMAFNAEEHIEDKQNIEWVRVGHVLNTPGFFTLQPTSGSTPLPDIFGRTLKPKLVQRAETEQAITLPPEVNGTLEVEYLERPQFVEVVTMVINVDSSGPSNNAVIDALKRLEGQETAGPSRAQIPDNLPNQYVSGMVSDVRDRRDVRDASGHSVRAVEVDFQVWEQIAGSG